MYTCSAPDYLKDLIVLPQLICLPQIVLIVFYLCLFLNIAKFQMPADILLLLYGIIYHLLLNLQLHCQILSPVSKLIISILHMRMYD